MEQGSGETDLRKPPSRPPQENGGKDGKVPHKAEPEGDAPGEVHAEQGRKEEEEKFGPGEAVGGRSLSSRAPARVEVTEPIPEAPPAVRPCAPVPDLGESLARVPVRGGAWLRGPAVTGWQGLDSLRGPALRGQGAKAVVHDVRYQQDNGTGEPVPPGIQFGDVIPVVEQENGKVVQPRGHRKEDPPVPRPCPLTGIRKVAVEVDAEIPHEHEHDPEEERDAEGVPEGDHEEDRKLRKDHQSGEEQGREAPGTSEEASQGNKVRQIDRRDPHGEVQGEDPGHPRVLQAGNPGGQTHGEQEDHLKVLVRPRDGCRGGSGGCGSAKWS